MTETIEGDRPSSSTYKARMAQMFEALVRLLGEAGMPHGTQALDLVERIRNGYDETVAMLTTYRTLDREAATHVELPIVMRTEFTGEDPYVGWEGLGLALNEALDERDQYRKDAAALMLRVIQLEIEKVGQVLPPPDIMPDADDDAVGC